MDTLHIGSIITTPQLQDAIHIAVAPVVAYRTLRPGEHIGLTEGGEADLFEKPIGIVDPFLTQPVKKGDKFWLFLYPGSITSLKHFWTHPAFDTKPESPMAPVVTPNFPVVLPNQPPAPPKLTLPVLPEPSEADLAVADARREVELIADDCGCDAEELLYAADRYVQFGEYFSQGERFEGTYLEEGFWDHYETIRKVKVPESKKYSFFSCSC